MGTSEIRINLTCSIDMYIRASFWILQTMTRKNDFYYAAAVDGKTKSSIITQIAKTLLWYCKFVHVLKARGVFWMYEVISFFSILPSSDIRHQRQWFFERWTQELNVRETNAWKMSISKLRRCECIRGNKASSVHITIVINDGRIMENRTAWTSVHVCYAKGTNVLIFRSPKTQ